VTYTALGLHNVLCFPAKFKVLVSLVSQPFTQPKALRPRTGKGSGDRACNVLFHWNAINGLADNCLLAYNED